MKIRVLLPRLLLLPFFGFVFATIRLSILPDYCDYCDYCYYYYYCYYRDYCYYYYYCYDCYYCYSFLFSSLIFLFSCLSRSFFFPLSFR